MLDKTGTLTEGKPSVTTVVTPADVDEDEAAATGRQPRAVQRASAGAAQSSRPRARGLSLATMSDFAAVPGKGVTGKVEGRRLSLGNAALMGELYIAVPELETAPKPARGTGATAVFVAIDGRAAGVIAIADPIKPRRPSRDRSAAGDGLRIVMLTGDNRDDRRRGGLDSSGSTIEAEMLPEDKGVWSAPEPKGRRVAMAATASTMRRRWRRPTSGSPWAPGPMSRSKARGIRC